MRPSMIPDDASYTFADYFRLHFDIEDLLTHFGYTYQVANYCLPRSTRPLERLGELRNRLEESLPYVSLNNEIARREFLIAPVLLEVVRYTHAKIRTEFPISVNAQLKGTVDYYVQQANNLLIVEAKNADLQQGVVQLAVELVAFDQWLTQDTPLLYGVVSMGNIWQFAILDRKVKQVTQDFNLFRVPADLHELMPILVAILAE